MRTKTILAWIFRILAALLMFQTLFYKFSAAPEPVYIFSRLGMEPWGRIGSGLAELVASVGLLIPRTTRYGALLGLGIMLGAVAAHIFVIGIVVHVNGGPGDNGQLFIYALLVLISCAYLLWTERHQLLPFNPKKISQL